MQIYKLALLLLIAAILTSLSITFFYYSFVIENIVYYNMAVKVDDHFGLAVDNETLNFARVLPGQSAEKTVTFSNPSDHNIRVVILTQGNLSQWVKISDSNFVLFPGQKKTVAFEVLVPSYASFGNYSGEAKIIFKKEFFK